VNNLFQSIQPTIGVAIPAFWSGQFSPFLRGILDAASKFNFNILCFQGAYFNSGYNSSGQVQMEKSGKIIFDLLKHSKIDGLVIHSGSLRTLQQKKDLVDNCKSTFNIPMINVGSRLDDITNILIDNEYGMYELLDHLIHDHGYRKFGFIRGPAENKDSESRLASFRKILEENSIPVDESIITAPLVLSFDSGRNGIRELLAKSRKIPDVIVCASDLLASGAIHELAQQKIKVPDQIGVVGFNNSNFSEICVPALTTVSLKLYERSRYAVELLHGCFNGQTLPSHDIVIKSSLVLRRSCGCQSLGIQAIDQNFENSSIDNIQLPDDITLKSIQNDILKELKILKFPQPDELIIEFIQSFFIQINDFSKNSFIHKFSTLLHETFTNKDAYLQWHLALSTLEENLPKFVPADKVHHAKECILQGRVMIGDIAANEYKMTCIQLTERTSSINAITYGLINNTNLGSILNHLSKELPKTGLQSCYLSLYNDPQKPLDHSTLMLAYNGKQPIILPDSGISFKSEDIIPDFLPAANRNVSFIIEPLFYGENQIGFTLLEIDSLEYSFFSSFPSQLSAALWSALLFTKKEQTDATTSRQALSIAATNEQLINRTKELQNVLMQLQQNHDRMLASEKMSSLGRFTAGITHEMTTPLSTLSSTIDKLKKMLQNADTLIKMREPLKRREFVLELSNLVTLANKAVIRSTDFIRSIKAQSRDIKGVEIQTFKIIDIVNSVITFLNHTINNTPASIEVRYNEQCTDITGSPTRMTQAITNLLTNALDAIANKSDGKITITLTPFDIDKTLIRIEDNGCGIEARNLSNVFDPTFSTKPSGKGSGLGLSIVYEIITVEFCGSINVDSTVNKGTVFTLCIKNNLKGSV
jgi:DNA-binding LacI/PurR family transcriptional regulator/signal transduction histidine kinase